MTDSLEFGLELIMGNFLKEKQIVGWSIEKLTAQ